MPVSPNNFPPMPTGIDEKAIQPSATFKAEVVKVAVSIAVFALLYAALVAATFGLAALCMYAGFMLVVLKPAFFTLMIGLGIAGLGIMVAFFMLKFIFKRSKKNRSNLRELHETEQPELFAFIRQLTTETQTPFPKKIFISDDVNASVFYDSSFWSMFLPVKKNLVIGLGLVNCVNLSEFKAVLAHEFGHFSQRSMKLGSFVYNVNQIIYDLLYDNDGYEKALEKWANISGYFAFFARLTIGIVNGIQRILQKTYSFVNRNYMSLSRQMEFHADAVAAYVSGGNHLVSSLRRLEAADLCYQRVIASYNSWVPQNIRAANFYKDHTTVMQHFAGDYKIPFENGLLQVDAGTMAFFNHSRLEIKNQWASHPSAEDRETHLNSLNFITSTTTASAWTVFRDAEKLQQEITGDLYSEVTFTETAEVFQEAAFNERYYREYEEASFEDAYKGYYDEHSIERFDITEALEPPLENATFDELFSDKNCTLPKALNGMERDAAVIHSIKDGNSGIKTFDFDGHKYTAADVYDIEDRLSAEILAAKRQISLLDKQIFRFFYNQAEKQNRQQTLLQDYENLFVTAEKTELDIAAYNKLAEEIQLIYQREMSFDAARNVVSQINALEIPVKARLTHLLEDPFAHSFITPELRETANAYLKNQEAYFTEPGFNDEAMTILNQGLQAYIQIAFGYNFKTKKEFLQNQLTLLKPETRKQTKIAVESLTPELA